MDVDLTFYDTTSIHFEVEREYEVLRRRGYSKNGQGDTPQVVVGMAVTRDGYPVKFLLFSGNGVDETTLEEVKRELRGWRLNRCIFVTDAGIVSEENLTVLCRSRSHYIVAIPYRKGTEAVSEVLSHPGRYEKVRDNNKIKKVRVSGRRYVVCDNSFEAERQKKCREEVLTKLKEELLVSQSAIREKEKRDGLWVFHTNDEALSAEDLAPAYKQVGGGVVEDDEVDDRDTPSVSPDRGLDQGAMFICALALLVELVAEKACDSTWPGLREDLCTKKIVQLLRPNGRFSRALRGVQKFITY